MAKGIVHFEVYVDEVERAKAFYEAVFGWAFKELGPDMNNYVLVFPDGEITDGPARVGINGGMMLRPGPAPENDKAAPNAYVCTLLVDNVDEILGAVEAHGGRIDMPAMDVPTVGRLAYIRDTEMNLVQILQPDMHDMAEAQL